MKSCWADCRRKGYRITETPEEAEVIIVNTCSFIRSAVEESIETILEAARFKEQGVCRVLGVTGCFPQRYREELVGRLPEVDFFLGTESFLGIARHVREALARAGGTTLDLKPDPALWREPWERLLTTPPGTAYLKIAEGCSNRCAYCTIPDIRGPFRSRDPKILVTEAESLAARGVKELILVAQDTTAYGGDLSRPASLMDLITSLAGIDPIQWIRLLYLRPERVTPRLLEALAAVEKVCPYLDIPIQHASDRILEGHEPALPAAGPQGLISSYPPDLAPGSPADHGDGRFSRRRGGRFSGAAELHRGDRV